MYYLLEDNRIVDSEKENVYVNEYQGIKWGHKNNEHKTCLGLIKKQSENVFDFVDWNNDLVRVYTACGFMIVDCNHAKSDFSDGYYNVEWINAIYKPDANGNYIKVWEVKENG